jgi:hypothetical protein
MQQAAQRSAPPDAVVDVRAVRVAGDVGERVVLAVVGHPRDGGALDRRRAQGGEHSPRHPPGLEAAVREQAMEADRDAEPRQGVHDGEDDEVARSQHAVPCVPDRDPEASDRQGGDESGDRPVERLVLHGLDVGGAALRCHRILLPARRRATRQESV